ncbi:ABC transporter substrate-binding protein [Leucobacter sp. CSA1]|uniref:ABC transporter substrate-binding protein n=1 Tax=Leucobacter chromiisoli TaxID=2796471 RepID=A0A934Q7D1_9MICO|nr:ABC transporter substrate-binding protein [Leucobacter chromiisoli]MBK0417907.1 ABC transporter substrate-binding protein [Leucobacter chromiisoli]
MKKKTFAAVALVAAAMLTVTGCSGSKLQQEDEASGSSTAKADKLIFGVSNGYPPMEYTDPETKEFTGFDVDLGNAIAEELGKEAVWEEMEFDQLINSLKTSRVDATMSGMSDTVERQETIDFVDYVKDGPQFFTSNTQAAEVKTRADLCGTKVGTVSGTTYVERIEEWSAENCPADQAIEVLRMAEGTDVLLQLKQDRIAGAMLGTVSLAYQLTLNPDTYTLVEEPLSEDLYGIGVKKGNEALLTEIHDAIEKLREDGTYDELLTKYGLEDYGVDEVTINLGE